MDQYLALSKLANSVVYEDAVSVQACNSAVDGMYSIVRNAGEEELSSLISLLEDPSAKIWLAHQLIEHHSLSESIEDKCFKIVQDLASQDSLNTFGEQQWLKTWEHKLGRA